MRSEEIPAETLAELKQSAQHEAGDKPAEIAERIIQGKLAKFYEENCLLEQAFIKDESVKIKDLITALHRQNWREHHRSTVCTSGSWWLRET